MVENVPLPVVLMSCVVFACQQMLQDDQTANRIIKSGIRLLDTVEMDRRRKPPTFGLSANDYHFIDDHIRPMLERFRAHFCSSIDPPYALRLVLESRRPTFVSIPCIPAKFSNLHEARDCLDDVLQWICSAIKVAPRRPAIDHDLKPLVKDLSSQWANALDAAAVEECSDATFHRHVQTAKLLRAAHRTSLVMIQTTGAESEMDFDDYVDEFSYIIALYEDILSAESDSRSMSKIKCGIDTGMIATLMFAQKRCRDPTIRRRAIDILSHIHRTEGDLGAGNSAALGNIMIAMEESGLGSVSSCKDIPESSRLRLLDIGHFWKTRQRRVRFIRPPYDPELGAVIVELWSPLLGSGTGKQNPPPNVGEGSAMLPNRITGRGYAEFLEEDSTSYYRTTPSQFFFPIPQL